MKIFSFVFLASLLFINFAHADDNNNYTADLGTLMVDASRSNDTVGQMNKDVTIITSKDIAASPAKDLPDLLSTLGGVDARVNSNIHETQVDMGQFGELSLQNTVILVDGMRLNVPDLSAPDLAMINLNSIDHIEIIQGAGTVLYGDNADGGVINIVTKKGEENTKPSVTLTSEVDSYKGMKDGISLSGGLPTLTYQFDYERQQSNNYRTFNDYWGNDYDAHLSYNPTDIFGIDFAQGYHVDRYELPGGLTPEEISSEGPTGDNNTRISYGTDSDSHIDITPHLKLEAGASTIDLSLFTSARKIITNGVFPPPTSFPEGLNYETESYEFQPKAIITTPLTDRLDNKLTTGYDYIYYNEKRRVDAPSPSSEDVVYANEASQNVYLLDELTLDDRWLLNTGARGAWTSYVFNQQQPTADANKNDRSMTNESYEGGLGYRYNPTSKVFVNYSHVYVLPNLDEFFSDPYEGFPASFNPDLSPQTGNQYQLGIKDNSFKNIHLGFTFTQVEYKNEIYDDPNTGENINYNSSSRHYMEEPEISADLFNGKLHPYANVTFQQTEFIGGTYSGSRIPDVPEQLAHAGIIWNTPLDGLSTSVQDDFVGKRFTLGDDQNIYPQVKRYDTVDWNIKYDYKNYEFWFSLNNIFDAHYYINGSAYGIIFGSTTDEVYDPAPGRNVAAGIKLTF